MDRSGKRTNFVVGMSPLVREELNRIGALDTGKLHTDNLDGMPLGDQLHHES